ncbi:MAG: DHH family phosphoesterase [Eggerthellaceae bacterium]|jgi:phosphoesterase RecJ-like protein|nr:DHH family phosphoesterase [Eggerthellaceae bacterium]
MTVTPQTNADLHEIAELILERDDFVLCGHVSPDGDCLGSQLCLWHALRALGKSATCVLAKDDPTPADVSFLPGIDEIVPAARFEGAARTFIGLDVPTRERAGEAACAILDASRCSITIDHHAVPERMCEYAYVDPDSASTSIMVWDLVKMLCDVPPAESALCAYTGLVTDTGGFRYQNSDTRAFAAAAELVGLGVDPAFVAAKVFQCRSWASLKLESLALDRMLLNEEKTRVLSWVSESDMKNLDARKDDTEELIVALRSMVGVRVACMLREQDDTIRGSLRAKDDTDVSMLARKLGGGGHRAAAGFTLECDLKSAIALLESELDALVGDASEE